MPCLASPLVWWQLGRVSVGPFLGIAARPFAYFFRARLSVVEGHDSFLPVKIGLDLLNAIDFHQRFFNGNGA